jgi:L-malate glycosyltransferase
MNIGIISTIGDSYEWAGSEEMWKGVAQEALTAGHQVSVSAATPIIKSGQAKALESSGARLFTRSGLGPFTRRMAQRGWHSRYRSYLKKKYDIICISMGGIGDVYWLPDLFQSLVKTELPYVVIVQANAEGLVEGECYRHALREFYSKAACVVFVSQHNLELAERQLGMKFHRSILIPNPLRTEVLESIPWPVQNICFRLAEVARLELADKQQDHLLKALTSEVWRNRNWKLTFYGSGPDEGHIRRLIDFYQLTNKVEIGGFVSDFRDIWRENHLHILPSRREGMPLSLIESMACGRPAVVTRAGGSAELVEHSKSGWICPGMHPEVLADTLETAWEARHHWQAMGLAARERVMGLQEPDWAGRILRILEEATHSQR